VATSGGRTPSGCTLPLQAYASITAFPICARRILTALAEQIALRNAASGEERWKWARRSTAGRQRQQEEVEVFVGRHVALVMLVVRLLGRRLVVLPKTKIAAAIVSRLTVSKSEMN
jgi:hypothetical protein